MGATSPLLLGMAVLSQGVGVSAIVQLHAHSHQQLVRGSGGEIHCHPGAGGGEGGGLRGRLVIAGGPAVLQYNHSDGFW